MIALATVASCSSSSGDGSPAGVDGGPPSDGGKSPTDATPRGDGMSSNDGMSSMDGSGMDSMPHPPPDGGGGADSGPIGDAGTCLGSSLLGKLGKNHLLVGGSMQAATAAMAPFDLQYVYVSGGFPDGTGPCMSCASGCTTNGTTCANSGPGCSWWGCWQYDQDPPGAYVRTFVSTWTGATPPQIPMITYYEILQASGVTEGSPEVTQAATNATFMARYFNDWRFLLQQIGSSVALLHIEPDFWGYAEQYATVQGTDATMLPAAVATANPTDCGAMPNSIAGMGQCLIAMVRAYAPNAFVGLHASAWSTNIDVSLNTDPNLDVAGEAQKTAAFLAACGETGADFVVVETSDRDAGYYQTVQMRNTWWDATNAALPDFHQDFAWVKALTEAVSQPALWWQTPLGNMSQNNTPNHYQDNRVDYFLGHMSELAAAHGVGAAFGAGAGDQTTPESDGGNFVARANAYFSAGGQPLCQ